MLFAGEREDPEEKGEKSIDGGGWGECPAEPAFCNAMFGIQLIQRRCVVGGRERHT